MITAKHSFYITMIVFLLVAGCADKSASEKEVPANQIAAEDSTIQGDDMAKEIAVFETTKGNIEIQLYRDNALITVENFVNYVNSGFYNGTIFHRVIPNFMIQGGGFTADGKQKKTNAPIKLESDNNLKNKVGTVAMARTGVPDSATAQFFINVVDNPSLDYKPGNPGYAVFGKVAYGMDAVNEIRDVETGTKGMFADWPVEDVVITSAYMKK